MGPMTLPVIYHVDCISLGHVCLELQIDSYCSYKTCPTSLSQILGLNTKSRYLDPDAISLMTINSSVVVEEVQQDKGFNVACYYTTLPNTDRSRYVVSNLSATTNHHTICLEFPTPRPISLQFFAHGG